MIRLVGSRWHIVSDLKTVSWFVVFAMPGSLLGRGPDKMQAEVGLIGCRGKQNEKK